MLKMTDREIIAAAYDNGVDEEFNRLVSNPLFEAEFELITELMIQYIPEESVIIDIGAGPGRYAEFLLKRNCKVGLVDLSEKSLIEFGRRINNPLRENILFSKVSCATNLSFIKDSTADAVFLMGPLYHLTGCDERTKAISEAFRILKNGGFLFAVFMSTFDHAQHFHKEGSLCCSDYVKNLLKDSVTTVKFQGYSVPQYKCLPEIAVNSIEPQGFGTMHIRNLEGVGVHYPESELIKCQAPQEKTLLFNKLRKDSLLPELSGLANQFLYVGRKNS
jgi:S-adenosylmethionine-dependent methyltransferase